MKLEIAVSKKEDLGKHNFATPVLPLGSDLYLHSKLTAHFLAPFLKSGVDL